MPRARPKRTEFRDRFEPIFMGSFGHPPEATRVVLYARQSTAEQQSNPDQLAELRAYAKRRGWVIAGECGEIISGAKARRPHRDRVLAAARRREIDAVAVARLDRWGRSVEDLCSTLRELDELGVAFVSLREAIDLKSAAGRAWVGILAVFAEFERGLIGERVRTGVAAARARGVKFGRRASVPRATVRKLASQGLSQVAIARKLKIGRGSVQRALRKERG